MLSRRLQLPQSLTRQRQCRLQCQFQWSLHLQAPLTSTRSQSQSSTTSPSENNWKDESSQSSPPLFDKLFPPTDKVSNPDTKKKKSKKSDGPRRRSRGGAGNEALERSLNSLRHELQGPYSGQAKQTKKVSPILSEFASWVGKRPPARARRRHNDSKDFRVLVLQSASRYLVESDFSRLAGQVPHLDGWARGIIKVIQARSPVTHQPLGKYFIFFAKSSSAHEYLQEVLRLHAKARIYAAKISGESTDEDTTAQEHGNLLEPDMDNAALLKHYTLLPPGAPLKILRRTEEMIRDTILKEQQWSRKTRGRAASKSKAPEENPETLQNNMLLDDGVTDFIESLDLPMDQNKVLIKLAGSKTTTYALQWAIDADSRRRNLLWRLQNPSSAAIQPLEYSKHVFQYSKFNARTAGGDFYQPPDAGGEDNSPKPELSDDIEPQKKYPEQHWGQLWEDDKGTEYRDEWENRGSPGKVDAKHEGFGSFIVSFMDPDEARRFVREWHKRQLWDHRTERWMTVDATWLW